MELLRHPSGRDARQVRQPAGLSCALTLLSGFIPWQWVWAQTAPRVPVNALPVGAVTEKGDAIRYQTSANAATITQTAPGNIVRWNSFDIGKNAAVNVVQPSANAVLLNKVEGGAYLGKTTIEGMLAANGRVYIYNPNGIVFGKDAEVNVNTLIASSLKFDESRVIAGLLQPATTPVLAADPARPVAPGNIDVEAGARLTAGNGGLILLAAPNVANNGRLTAVDGQVVLAAGNKVYLAAPNVNETGTSLRGLLVEVGDDYVPPKDAVSGSAYIRSGVGATATGDAAPTAENGVSGRIDVGRGNATMVAYAVNQKGTVSATTSVNLNGSIHLLARDQTVYDDVKSSWQATRSGNLVLGAGSVTRVDAVDTGETITAATPFNPSVVKLNGADIRLEDNAKIVAPGGNVTIAAERLFGPLDSADIVNPKANKVRVDIGAGAVIDVSGSKGAELPMESNIIQVDLRGTELADNLVLRNSALYGSKVNIDIRKPQPAGTAANVSGWLDQVQYGLGQLNTKGGTVSISAAPTFDTGNALYGAGGAIVFRTGSRINVDGGWVDYKSGYANTSQFRTSNGTLVDVSAAAAGTPYASVVNAPNSERNFEPGYRQGGSAGTIQLNAPVIAGDANPNAFSGEAVRGSHQRIVGATGYPQGGQLIIGGYASPIVLGSSGGGLNGLPAPPPGAPVAESESPERLSVAPSNGFSRLSLTTSGSIRVAEAVELPAGGQLSLSVVSNRMPEKGGGSGSTSGIGIEAPITIPSGSVGASVASGLSGGLSLTKAATIDVAGRWVNDLTSATSPSEVLTTPVPIAGGSVKLSAQRLNVDEAKIDASAGAWLDGANGKVTRGKAGGIQMRALPSDGDASLSSKPGDVENNINLPANGDAYRAYGFDSGGSLKIQAGNVQIAKAGSDGTSPQAKDLRIDPSAFQSGGFTSYDIAANTNFTIAQDTVVAPQAQTWQLKANYAQTPSGPMSSVASPVLLDLAGPRGGRPPASVNFSALSQVTADGGRFLLDTGARVQLDPGANLGIHAGRQMTVLGTLSAPAGNILLDMTGTAYYPERGIWFGPQAQVLATGSLSRLYTGSDGIAYGDVLDGGSIRIGSIQNGAFQSAFGYVVAEAGSVFNVGGVTTPPVRMKSAYGLVGPAQQIGSAGGSIDIRARTGLLIEGSFLGGGGGGAGGGSLSFALDREDSPTNYPGDDGQRILTLLPGRNDNIVPSKLQPNQPIVVDKKTGRNSDQWLLAGSGTGPGAKRPGQGWIATRGFEEGNFSNLRFKSQDVLAFGLGKSDLTLAARDSLVLDAPNFRAYNRADNGGIDGAAKSHNLALNAPYIQLGSADQRYQAPDAAVAGKSGLVAQADTIDLIGNSAWQGIGEGKLTADHDMRLVGVAEQLSNSKGNVWDTGYAKGSLAMVGNLTLKDSRIYPTTLSDYVFNVAGSADDAKIGNLTFALPDKGVGSTADSYVLSAGGSLTANAKYISQQGRMYAPLGSIALGNTDSAQPIVTESLTFAADSLTSVAGGGPVPFGTVQNGSVPIASQWQYVLGDGTVVTFKQDPNPGPATPERSLPTKSIVASAKTVDLKAGSTQDVSGGGSLLAYEFTPGKGGSKDVLQSNGDKTDVFAINPNFRGPAAPLDANYGQDGLRPGDSVYLSGFGDLPAGTYTLLPAHYALLPGGYSVSPLGSAKYMQPGSNTFLGDGAMLVAGHATSSGSGQRGRDVGFVVSPRDLVLKRSEFAFFDADGYFTDKAQADGLRIPERPVDGGHVAITATDGKATALNWASQIELAAAGGGRSGILDISAPKIAVVGERDPGNGDAVQLLARDLTALGADSLLLGATRSVDAEGNARLAVGARSVQVNSDAQHALAGRELMLAASDSIEVARGALIDARGAPPGRQLQSLQLDGPGALVRLGSGAQVDERRSNPTDASGTVRIAAGSTLRASGSAILDGTAGVDLSGVVDVAQGGALTLAAPRMALGSALPSSLDDVTLRLDTQHLDGMAGLARLALESYGSAIDLYGNAKLDLGLASGSRLSFRGAGFQSHGGGADSSIRLGADTVRFAGTSSSGAAASGKSGKATLAVEANTLEFGDNGFAASGFAGVNMMAHGEAVAVGRNGSFSSDGDLTLKAARIATRAGADAGFNAGNTLTLSALPAGGDLPEAAKGGRLGFSAQTIESDIAIEAPSGRVAMKADHIAIKGGKIDVAGSPVSFGEGQGRTTVYAPGGGIELAGGKVDLAEAAILDVSSVGADAGVLALSAVRPDGTGSLSLLGQIKGGASAVGGVTPTQGRFALDADGGADAFGQINQKLNLAGFNESRQFRFRRGDASLGGNDQIMAHRFVLAVDDGGITVGGDAVIDASGAKGGSIELYAAKGDKGEGRVTVRDRAQLLAKGTAVADGTAGSAGNGGRIVIGSGLADGGAGGAGGAPDGAAGVGGVGGVGGIALSGGSLDVSGSSEARNGSVILRAPRTTNGAGKDDVAIAEIGSRILGSSATVVEAYKTYQAKTISEAADTTVKGNADTKVKDGAKKSGTAYDNLSATSSGVMYVDADTFAKQSDAILKRLIPDSASRSAAGLALRPGIEVRSDSDLNVSVNEFAANPADRGWNLDAWRFKGAPAMLTLRAAGNLTVAGSISDGFVKPTAPGLAMPDWLLDGGASASLRLAAGADLHAARPMEVNHGGGDVVIGFAARTPDSAAPVKVGDAPVALVRTGTGGIDVAAGRDFKLEMAPFFIHHDSNPAADGTPAIFDRKNDGGSYAVTLYGASLYTAGAAVALPDASKFAAPENTLNGHFGAAADATAAARFGGGGGSIKVEAGRDVIGAQNLTANWSYRNYGDDAQPPDRANHDPGTPAVPGSVVALPRTVPQLVNDWLFRQGRSYVDSKGVLRFEEVGDGKKVGQTLNTAWWARTDYFATGLATFGGGDLSVDAGGNVSNLTAAVATSAYTEGKTSGALGSKRKAGAPMGAIPGVTTELGGGDLSVRAGGDIRGGNFYAQKGEMQLQARGSLTAGDQVPGADGSASALKAVLALGDTRVSVTAGRDLAIEAAFNPMLTEQSIYNVAAGSGFGPVYGKGAGGQRWDAADLSPGSTDYRQKYAQFSNYSTYASNTGVRLTAIGGDLLLSGNIANLAVAGGNAIPDRLRGDKDFRSLYALVPSELRAAALNGNLSVNNAFVMTPAADGQLDLLAGGSINLRNGQIGHGIRLLDKDPASFSTMAAPRIMNPLDFDAMEGSATGVAAHVLGGLHADDDQPVRILAGRDIVGDGSGAATITLPKFASIQAGRDIRDLGFGIQHNRASDVTEIVAGRDFVVSTVPTLYGTAPSPVSNVVTGPGRIDIRAGRNVDFGNGNGLVTRGNLDNPYLPEGGAAIDIVAGALPTYEGFVNFALRYGSAYVLTPTKDELSQLAGFLKTKLKDFLVGNSISIAASTSTDSLIEAFNALPANLKAANPSISRAVELLKLTGDDVAVQGLLKSSLDDLRALVLNNVNNLLAIPPSRKMVLDAFASFPATVRERYLREHAAVARDPDLTKPENLEALSAFVFGKFSDISANSGIEETWAAFRRLPAETQEGYLAGNGHYLVSQLLELDAKNLSMAWNSGSAPNLRLINNRYAGMLVEMSHHGEFANFDKAIAGGRDANGASGLFASARAATGGDIALFASQIKTEQGGDIDLLAPAGSVFAGLTTGSVDSRKASELGIFTIRGGAIRAEVMQDFLVNQGRVFSLGGGDITLTSQYGDIDAGKGAKTASSAPPPLITIDQNGNVKVDVSSSISGSGIATLKTHAGQADSNVFLIAPRGTVDAGDAGVRSSGAINVFANAVRNADNFAANGVVSGTSAATPAPPAAPVAAPASAGTQAADAAKNPMDAAKKTVDANRSLNVEVIGYGGESEDASTPAPESEQEEGAPKKKRKETQANSTERNT